MSLYGATDERDVVFLITRDPEAASEAARERQGIVKELSVAEAAKAVAAWTPPSDYPKAELRDRTQKTAVWGINAEGDVVISQGGTGQ